GEPLEDAAGARRVQRAPRAVRGLPVPHDVGTPRYLLADADLSVLGLGRGPAVGRRRPVPDGFDLADLAGDGRTARVLFYQHGGLVRWRTVASLSLVLGRRSRGPGLLGCGGPDAAEVGADGGPRLADTGTHYRGPGVLHRDPQGAELRRLEPGPALAILAD